MSSHLNGPYELLIGAAFTGHLVNVLILEPGLGFAAAADFHDFERIKPQLLSRVWQLGALYHGIVAFSLVGIAVDGVRRKGVMSTAPGRMGSAFALISAVCFVLIAAINVAGYRELEQIAVETVADARSGYFGLLAMRAAALSGALAMLGAALVSLAVASWKTQAVSRPLMAFQFLLGSICITFVVWPALAPLMIIATTVWGFWSGFDGIKRRHRNQS